MNRKRNLLLTPEEIEVIIDLFEKMGAGEIEIGMGDEKIRITKSQYKKIVKKEWHEQWWGKITIAAIAAIIAGLILLLLTLV